MRIIIGIIIGIWIGIAGYNSFWLKPFKWVTQNIHISISTSNSAKEDAEKILKTTIDTAISKTVRRK